GDGAAAHAAPGRGGRAFAHARHRASELGAGAGLRPSRRAHRGGGARGHHRGRSRGGVGGRRRRLRLQGAEHPLRWLEGARARHPHHRGRADRLRRGGRLVFAQHLEKLAAWATEGREEEILQARRAYFERIGEAHEEDRSFEARMSAFMEHFLFDRPLDGAGRPPVRVYLETRGDDLPPEEREALESLSRSVYGAFEVTKLGTRLGLRVREVLSRTEYDILERRELVALAKGDILNAR